MIIDRSALPIPANFESTKPGDLMIVDHAGEAFLAMRITGLMEDSFILLAGPKGPDFYPSIVHRSSLEGKVSLVGGELTVMPVQPKGTRPFSAQPTDTMTNGTLVTTADDAFIFMSQKGQKGLFSLTTGEIAGSFASTPHRVYSAWSLVQRRGEMADVLVSFSSPTLKAQQGKLNVPNHAVV